MTEITDDMVERCAEALRGLRPVGEDCNSARRILEAALNPPAEPEYPVSEGMLKAGHAALLHADRPSVPDDGKLYNTEFREIARIAYVAMRAVEEREKRAWRDGKTWHRHRRLADTKEIGTAHHRRSTDP